MSRVLAWLIILLIAGGGGWLIGGLVTPYLLALVVSFCWGVFTYCVLSPVLLKD